MKKVAKVILVDDKGFYLLLYRNDHPIFGNDPDLPGGKNENHETEKQTVFREVIEETGINIKDALLKRLYSGTEYSQHNTHYSLFITQLKSRPTVTLSWEHSYYEWVTREVFLEKSKNAVDTYMHMTYEISVKQSI